MAGDDVALVEMPLCVSGEAGRIQNNTALTSVRGTRSTQSDTVLLDASGSFKSMGSHPPTMIGCSKSKMASVRSVVNRRPELFGGRLVA